MATLNYQLDRTKNKNGKYTVRLIVRNGTTQSSLATPVEVLKSQWLSKPQRVKGGKQENDILDSLIEKAQAAIKTLRNSNRLHGMKACYIIDFIKNFDTDVVGTSNGDFIEYWQSIAMLHPKSATKYRYALKSLVAFNITTKGSDTILFRDITSEYIRTFLFYLKETPYIPQHYQQKNIIKYKQRSPETIATYAATLKAVLNCAIDDDKLSANAMKGFRKVSITRKSNNKKIYTLNLDELRRILNFDLSSYPLSIQMARDLFILSFCFQGMNLKDLYYLKTKNFHREDLNYIREKTGKEICLTLSEMDKIRRLGKPYSCKSNVWGEDCGNTDFLFAFQYHYTSYDSFKGMILKAVRKLRKILNYPNDFSFYTARDTWATICSVDYNLGQEHIDAGLGHSSKSLAANHYISIDLSKIAQTHADILKRLFQK